MAVTLRLWQPHLPCPHTPAGGDAASPSSAPCLVPRLSCTLSFPGQVPAGVGAVAARGCSRARAVLSPLFRIPGEGRQRFPSAPAAVGIGMGQFYYLGRGPKGQLVFGLFPGFPVTAGSFSLPTLTCNMWKLGS